MINEGALEDLNLLTELIFTSDSTSYSSRGELVFVEEIDDRDVLELVLPTTGFNIR